MVDPFATGGDENGPVSVRRDCRHYSSRSTATGDVLHRCRLGVNEDMPFACPEDCLFFEPRHVTDTGWTVEGETPPP